MKRLLLSTLLLFAAAFTTSAFAQSTSMATTTSLDLIATQQLDDYTGEFSFRNSTGADEEYRISEQGTRSFFPGFLLRQERPNGTYQTFGVTSIGSQRSSSVIFRIDNDNEIFEVIGIGETSRFNIGLRYELGGLIGNPKVPRRLNAHLGVFVDPQFRVIKQNPTLPLGFPYRQTQLGLWVGPNFSLSWEVANRIRILTATPLAIFRLGVDQFFFGNPFILESERKQTELNLDVGLQVIQLQFGLQVQL